MKVFISYAASEQDLAKDLASRLSGVGYEVWYPDKDLFPGDNWPLKIGKALQGAEAMVVLISPDSVKSPWVRRDIEFALGSTRYAGRLIPVLVRPTDGIPWILKKLPLVRVGRNRAEATKRIIDRLRHTKALANA